MSSKKLVILVFALVALVQLFVPAKMILDRESVLKHGTEYKFKTAPIDPSDPFRGKYITLRYKENTVSVSNKKDWKTGESIYVLLTTDSTGFAKIKSASKTTPIGNEDFIKVKVGYSQINEFNRLTVRFPFNRYYMEESKAYDAELTHLQSQQDTSKTTYALVRVKNGDAVLKDVMINGISIREIVKQNRQEKN